MVQQTQNWAGGKRIVLDPDVPCPGRCVYVLKVGQVDEDTDLTGRSKVEDQAQVRFPYPDLFDLESCQRGELADGHDQSVTNVPGWLR